MRAGSGVGRDKSLYGMMMVCCSLIAVIAHSGHDMHTETFHWQWSELFIDSLHRYVIFEEVELPGESYLLAFPFISMAAAQLEVCKLWTLSSVHICFWASHLSRKFHVTNDYEPRKIGH